MKKRKVIIGVDLGGTKIMTGAIDTRGNILTEAVKIPTGANDEAEKILNRIYRSIDTIIDRLSSKEDEILGIGIGSTGPVDIEKGLILDCPQLPNMQYFPLVKKIEEHYKFPVVLNNDANSLILAETLFGAAKNRNNVVGFTLGTGIGCAIIFNQKIFNGATGTAGEIWASPYQNRSIEDFVSGKAVSEIYQNKTGIKTTAKDIHRRAGKGEKEALETWKEFGKHLSVAISWTINLIDPEVVVLGGSIAHAADFFIDSLEKHLRRQICSVPAEKTRIKIAKLGDNAGFTGAAALVLQELNNPIDLKTSIL